MTSQPQEKCTAFQEPRIPKKKCGKNLSKFSITQPSDPFIRYIPLSKGLVAIVDTFLYDWLMQWSWHVIGHFGQYYAATAVRENGVNIHVYMHVLIMGISPDDPRQGDHADRNKLNNVGRNLRHATSGDNNKNKGMTRRNTSGYIGVHWCKRRGKWVARITVNESRITVAKCDCKIEAAKAYDVAALKHYGEFAVLNFPLEVVA